MAVETWVLINTDSGMVENIFVWDGEQELNLAPNMLVIQTTEASIGWSYADGVFTPPPVAPPTPQQILASQSAILVSLKQLAESQKTALTNRVGTLNDAIELEMATPEEIDELPARKAQLIEWKRYAVLLGRVTSQAGWPPEVDWPAQPAAGMDLSVSARAEESFV